MKPDVLDRNLRALLTRAYEPALPAQAFRADLEQAFLERAAFRVAPPRARIHRLEDRRRAWRALVASAAAVLLLFLGGRLAGLPGFLGLFGGEPGLASAESILADAKVAVRFGPAEPWAAVEPAAAVAGIAYRAPFLELRTPEGVHAAIETQGAEARLALAEGGSWVVLRSARETEQPSLRLRAGGVAVADGSRLRVLTAEGELEVHGSARVAHVAWTEVAARFHAPDARVAAPVLASASTGSARLLSGAVDASPGALVGPGEEALLVGGRLLRPLERTAAAGAERVAGAETEAPGRRPVVAPGDEAEPAPEEAPALAPPSGIAGRAVDAHDGSPLGAFDVTILREANLPEIPAPRTRRFTDPDGRFELPDLRPGRYAVYVTAEGHAAWKREGVELGSILEAKLFDLDRGPVVRGYVVDAATGDPIGGAIVLSEADFPASILPLELDDMQMDWLRVEPNIARSAPDGSFELEGLSVGRHVLRASRPGHAPGWSSRFDLAPGEERTGLVLELGEPGAVEGRVHTDRGEPLPHVFVSATHADVTGEKMRLTAASTMTDADGRYRLEDMPPGFTTVVRVLLEDLQGSKSQAEVEPRISFTMIEPGKTSTVDFEESDRAQRLHGRIVGNRSLEGLGVMISPVESLDLHVDAQSWAASVLDADGSYEFEDVAPGHYVLFLSFGLNASFSYVGQVEVGAQGPTRFDVELGGGKLTGSVVAADTGALLPRSVVVLTADGVGLDGFAGKTLADEDGRFEFEFLPPGRYALAAYSPTGGYGNESLEAIRIEEGGEAEVVFRLYPGGGLDLLVVDAGGRPVERALVHFEDADSQGFGFLPVQETGREGRLTVEGSMAEGVWTVRVEADGHLPWSREIEIVSGVLLPVRAELRPAGE